MALPLWIPEVFVIFCQKSSLPSFSLYGKGICLMTVARERSRLVPPKAMPAGRPTPLANDTIEILPVITVDVIRPVSMMLVIVLNCFIFLAILSQTSILSSKYASIFVNFLSDMSVVFVVL